MKRFLSYTTMLFAVAVILFSAVPQDVYAKGFSSSRSSSFGSRSSSSSKSSGWGSKSSSSSNKSSGWGSKKSTVNDTNRSTTPKKTTTNPKTTTPVKPKLSAADQKALATAKANGTAFKSRAEATKSFQSNPQMKQKYTSSYATKPETRPSHIPSSTKGADGTVYNISYNSQHGGYGYMGPSGTWMMYDAMTDMAMLSILMNQNHYVVQPTYAEGTNTVVREKTNTGLVLIGILFCVGVFAFIIVIVARS